MQIHLVPEGWPVKFKQLRPGLFMTKDKTLCFKSEYGDDAYVVESGEAFAGGVPTKEEKHELEVQPVKTEFLETRDC